MNDTINDPGRTISLVDIVPSRWQPRRAFNADELLELASSIRKHGLLNPILVFRNEDGEIELLAGERRVRACVAASLAYDSPRWIAEHSTSDSDKDLEDAVQHLAAHSWTTLAPDLQHDLSTLTIPATIIQIEDHEALHQIAVVENLQRADLAPAEEAQALKDLLDEYGYSQRELAAALGKSQGWVQQRLALLDAAPGVQRRVNTRVFTVTHARALAPLPPVVQEQVASHVEELMKREGDTAATTRKVQNFASQAKEFLKPDRWEPNGSEPLNAETRNLRALLAHLLRNTDEAALAEIVVALKEAGDLGRKPQSADTVRLAGILSRFTTGLNRWSGTHTIWTRLAPESFFCDSCLWRTVHQTMDGQVEDGLSTGCRRLDGNEDAATCTHYVRQSDPRWPALLPVGRHIADYLPDGEPGLRRLGENGRGPYFATPDAFPLLYQAAVTRLQQREQQAQKEQDTGYLKAMRQFQALQADPATYLDLDHPQAHACGRCLWHRPDGGRDGVKCHYAAQPRKGNAHWNQGANNAPDYGLLVRRDGLTVPRCEEFLVQDVTTVLGAEPGKVALPREATLTWFRHLLKRNNTSYHTNALPRFLSWLIHPGDGIDQRLKRIEVLWDELWDATRDAQIARLLSVLVSEADAANNHRGPLRLVNPTTGETEEWMDVAWHSVTDNRLPYNYPEDWPQPWRKGGTS